VAALRDGAQLVVDGALVAEMRSEKGRGSFWDRSLFSVNLPPGIRHFGLDQNEKLVVGRKEVPFGGFELFPVLVPGELGLGAAGDGALDDDRLHFGTPPFFHRLHKS